MSDEYNLSASQIKTHSKCPKQYWFRYLGDFEATKQNKKYLRLGSRVHESIESILESDDSPSFDDTRSLRTAIQKVYRESDEHPVPDDLYSQGMDCCKTAASYLSKTKPEIVGIEERVEYQIDRGDVSTGVTSIMDIVTDSEIIDWKTGKIRDDISHDEKIQGSVYMAGYLELMDKPPEKVKFVYLKEGKVRKLEPDDDNWKYMMGHAKHLLRSKREEQFRAKPGDHCYFCEHEGWCESSPVGCGGVPYDEY